MSYETALVAAIVALAGAIAYLYIDKGKTERMHATATKEMVDRFATASEVSSKAFATASESAARAFTATMKEAGDAFAKSIKESARDHAEQEERIHAQSQKAMEDIVQDHRREMTGMVDRVLAARQNDKDHDRELAERMLRLVESLERRAQWKP